MSRIYQSQDFQPATEWLHDEAAATSDVFSNILAGCPRIRAMAHSEPAARLAKLIAAGAWTDAAVALVALELPRWQLRRVAYDDGQWHCALSNNREMPEWLDESIETHHADMALAILTAFAEARRGHATSHLSPVPAMRAENDDFEPQCCDNFS
jgi:hypothetical protein